MFVVWIFNGLFPGETEFQCVLAHWRVCGLGNSCVVFATIQRDWRKIIRMMPPSSKFKMLLYALVTAWCCLVYKGQGFLSVLYMFVFRMARKTFLNSSLTGSKFLSVLTQEYNEARGEWSLNLSPSRDCHSPHRPRGLFTSCKLDSTFFTGRPWLEQRPDPHGRQGYDRVGADGCGDANRRPLPSPHAIPYPAMPFPFPSFTVVPCVSASFLSILALFAFSHFFSYRHCFFQSFISSSFCI